MKTKTRLFSKFTLTGVVALGIAAGSMTMGSPASAADLRQAWKAYNSGDFMSAMEIWQQLAGVGNAEALYNLGVMYRDGKGTPKDLVVAHNLWTMAAEKKHVRAMHNLALAYIAGDVKEDGSKGPNYQKAVELLINAADKGFPNSLYTLGKLYGYGLGVQKDTAKEISYYILAAKAGSDKAQYNMGKAHRDGTGVVKDERIAASYFAMAAEQGHPQAQNHLATRYANGIGVEQNDIFALKWALIADKFANKDAEENIKVLKMRMDDREIAVASRMADEYKPIRTKYKAKK